jgi:hypothetical protein
MSDNWTQAWIKPDNPLFLLAGTPLVAPDPLTIESTNGSTMILTVGNDNTASITTAGLGGLNNNEIRFEDKVISFNVDQPYDSLRVGDDVEVNTSFFIQNAAASNYLRITSDNNIASFEYFDSTSILGRIDITNTGNVQLNTYVVAEPNGVFTVLSTTLASTQITGTDILFSDTSNDPIASIFVNGTGLSMTCSNFPYYPGITLTSTNTFVVNSGFQIIDQSLSNFGGVESAIAFAANAPNPTYYIINSTINDAPNGRYANQLNFMSPYNATTYNFFQLDAIGGNTNFNRGIRMYYNTTIGANSGQIAFLGGGGDGNYGGRVLTDSNTNGLYISANNFGASSLANLFLFGSTIQLGTAGSPANVTINGAPISIFPSSTLGIDGLGATGDFYSIPVFPGIDAAFNMFVLNLTTGLNSLSSFCVTMVVNGFNNNNAGITTVLSWRNSDLASLFKFCPQAFMNAGVGACLTSTKRFYQGVHYTSTTASLSFQLSSISGDPRFVAVNSWYSIS